MSESPTLRVESHPQEGSVALESGGQLQGRAALGKPEPWVSDSLWSRPAVIHLGSLCHRALHVVDVQCIAVARSWNILNGQIQLNHFDSMTFFLNDFGRAGSSLTRVPCKKLCGAKRAAI